MSARPFCVLHVFGQMQRAGAELRTLDLMRHLDRGRFRFEFCALSGLAGELDEEIRALGGEVHRVALNAAFAWRFVRLLGRRRIDAVHSHVHYSSGFILRLAARTGVPVRICHFRTTDDGRARTLRRRAQTWLLKRWIDRHATHILAVSKAAMTAAWGDQWTRDPRCRVIYNALDPALFAAPADREGVRREFGLPLDCRLYIHVGRMDPPKNHLRLIPIFGEIARLDPAARLLLVGRGGDPMEPQVREMVRRLHLLDGVALAGNRSDIVRLVKAADLMIFPSLWEGLPGAVLEAASAGIPVLASDLPGVRELAEHLSRIEALSLERADRDWALRAAELASSRHELCVEGLPGPFQIETALRHWENIYRREPCPA